MNELPSFSYAVPPEFVTVINQIVANDEGGWVFTNNRHDPGGMTFGGMTYRTFYKAMERYGERISDVTFAHCAQTTGAGYMQLKYRVIQAYYDVFIKDTILTNSLFSGWPLLPMLSCAINLGMDDVVKIIQQMCNDWIAPELRLYVDGKWGPKTNKAVALVNTMDIPYRMKTKTFLEKWQRTYINLVQNNSDAWEKYITAVEFEMKTAGLDLPSNKPETKRWKNLEGWFNRVGTYA